MYKSLKRLLDILLAGAVVILVLPLLLLIILILRFTAEREVFYLQQRMGQFNRTFRVFKFATMLKNSERMGTGTITLRKDPRVTPFGSFLRITKLNELPQLFNILRGEMSIVGPRPLVPKDFENYNPEVRANIYNVKPGLSGIGSIIFRDEQLFVSQSNMDPYEYYRQYIVPYKGQVELWYQAHASMRTDLLIIFLTAWSIFFPKSEMVYRIFPSLPPRPDALDPKLLRPQ